MVEFRFSPAAQAPAIDAASTGRPAESLVYLPMVGRKSFWTVLIKGPGPN